MGKVFSIDISYFSKPDKKPQRPKIPTLQVTSSPPAQDDGGLERSVSMDPSAMTREGSQLEAQSKMRISQSTGALYKMTRNPFKKQQPKETKQRKRRRRRGFSLSIADFCGPVDVDDTGSDPISELRANDNCSRISSASSSMSSTPSPASDRGSLQMGADALCHALKAVEQWSPRPNLIARQFSSFHIQGNRDLIYEYYSGGNFGRKIGIDLSSEQDIQQRQFFLLKRVWGTVYQAPIKNPELIVHWMCGSGQWEIDMTRQFPEAHVVGIDYKPIPMARLFQSPKVKYLELTAKPYSNGMHGLEKFEENSVDFLVLRDIWFLDAKSQQWNEVLKQAVKILKPGGWLEVYEQRLPPTDGGPQMDQIQEWVTVCKTVFQIIQEESKTIYDKLIAEGFTNVTAQPVEVPVGEWGSTPVLQETGYYAKDLKRRELKIRSAWIRYANKIGYEQFNETLERALDDCEYYRAHVTWTCYNAQKQS